MTCRVMFAILEPDQQAIEAQIRVRFKLESFGHCIGVSSF